MQTSYALYCVHQEKWHYLQSAPTLEGVKVGRTKVLNWMESMGIVLSHEFPTTLVIQHEGRSILSASFGPPTHGWRPVKDPTTLTPPLQAGWAPGGSDPKPRLGSAPSRVPKINQITSADVDAVIKTRLGAPCKARLTYAEIAAAFEQQQSDSFQEKTSQSG